MALVAPFWPQRPWFLKLLSLLAGPPSSEGPCCLTHVSSASAKAGVSSYLTLAAFREKGKQAGFTARVTEFPAEALRESTQASYDSKLECFFKWCNDIPCDPSSASLGQVADFLVYLFDKGLAISTIRSYRSAITTCHNGFRTDLLFQGPRTSPDCVGPSF